MNLLSKYKSLTKEPVKGIHSELHNFIYETRKEYGETAKKGKGSFGFYLGFIKRLGLQEAYRIRAEVKQSNAKDHKKLFWWKVGQELRRKKSKSSAVKGDLSTGDKS